MTAKNPEAGVTLMELLIAVTLLSMLSVGMVIALRVGLSAMNKTDSKLMSNRRVAGVERILEEDVAAIMPVTADCQGSGAGPTSRIAFFQGEPDSMRFVTAYSLQQAARGMPTILEYHVIPGENGQGVRLVVNEHLYTGPRGAGLFCTGVGSDPITGAQSPQFLPIETGPGSFVLADKLAYCRFSYRELLREPDPPRWVTHWIRPLLPNAIRFEMEPLVPDASRLQPVTLTIPVHVTRLPLELYAN